MVAPVAMPSSAEITTRPRKLIGGWPARQSARRRSSSRNASAFAAHSQASSRSSKRISRASVTYSGNGPSATAPTANSSCIGTPILRTRTRPSVAPRASATAIATGATPRQGQHDWSLRPKPKVSGGQKAPCSISVSEDHLLVSAIAASQLMAEPPSATTIQRRMECLGWIAGLLDISRASFPFDLPQVPASYALRAFIRGQGYARTSVRHGHPKQWSMGWTVGCSVTTNSSSVEAVLAFVSSHMRRRVRSPPISGHLPNRHANMSKKPTSSGSSACQPRPKSSAPAFSSDAGPMSRPLPACRMTRWPSCVPLPSPYPLQPMRNFFGQGTEVRQRYQVISGCLHIVYEIASNLEPTQN